MSIPRAPSNKTMSSPLHDAVKSSDAEVISKTVDEVVAPDVLFHAPLRGAVAPVIAMPFLQGRRSGRRSRRGLYPAQQHVRDARVCGGAGRHGVRSVGRDPVRVSGGVDQAERHGAPAGAGMAST